MVAAAATPSSLFPNPLQARFPALPLRGVFVIHLSYRQGVGGTGRRSRPAMYVWYGRMAVRCLDLLLERERQTEPSNIPGGVCWLK